MMTNVLTALVTLAFWWVFVVLTEVNIPLALGWVAAVILVILALPLVERMPR